MARPIALRKSRADGPGPARGLFLSILQRYGVLTGYWAELQDLDQASKRLRHLGAGNNCRLR
jgi:hypothetical protein